ncbi:MAG: 30S ribosomal protein S7 [Kiritimatiellae bacterium]|nr:30S ribosomal protein S7 [Kiritimatiellia bacterium]
MPRRRRPERRALAPDPRYNSEMVASIINQVMERGKKSTAERVVYGALDIIKEKMSENPLEVVMRAVDNVKPRLEVKSRRVGGATYQVPVEVSPKRQASLALRWLVLFSQGRRGMPMRRALALELMDAYKNQGNAVKKRDDTHKMAQANKAFAHYRW